MLHSPCEIDTATRDAISALGRVACIVAPGSYHYLYTASAQAAFPDADTYICPGVERKDPSVDFDWFLSDRAPDCWAEPLDRMLVRGNKFIWEVAFFLRASKTLILVDLIENIGDNYPDRGGRRQRRMPNRSATDIEKYCHRNSKLRLGRQRLDTDNRSL